MKLRINNQSGIPIYQQLYEQIKQQILEGELGENEQLPTMRYLAKELRVSVVTTKRVYDELERDGFIYSIQGKGSFVCVRNKELLKEEFLKKMESHLMEALKYGYLAELSLDEIITTLKIFGVDNE